MPSFLIAEDHSVVRMGVILFIRECYPDATFSEADTFDAALQILHQQTFDLLLLDIHMPGGDNLQMVDAVRLRQPHIPILIFSGYDEQQYAPGYLKAGANGYLTKSASPQKVQTAIQKVLSGEKYISAPVQDKLLNDLLYQKGNSHVNPTALSNRETEVMHLLVKGASASEIKKRLNIRDSTISTHKAKIFEKMDVTNVIQLAEKVKALGSQMLHS